jgi:hypothetical protein
MKSQTGKSPSGRVSTRQAIPNPLQFLIVPLLLVLCLGLFPASNLLACHTGKPHGPHTCGGGDPGPVVGGPTLASFIGPNYLDDDAARACTPLGDMTTATGSLVCSTAESLRISTVGMNLNSRKRDAAFCRSLENLTTVDPISPNAYQYGWTDDCSDGACQIVVDLSFSGQRVFAATGGKSDAVDIRVTGTLVGASLPGNPFSSTQELAMSQMTMQFLKPGDTAIAAVCNWFPQISVIDPAYEHFVFTSVPVSPP